MNRLSVPMAREEIVRWLQQLAGVLDRSLAGEERERIVGELRDAAEAPRASLSTLCTLALLDDCLRVVHMATGADGIVESDEVRRVTSLIAVAATRYAMLRPGYEHVDAADETALDEFLRAHRDDRRPFGYGAAAPWRGLGLCRSVAKASGNLTVLDEYERVLVQLMEDVFAGRDSGAERQVRQALDELLHGRPGGATDARGVAFCRPDGPEVFSSVSYGSQIAELDPFDVEDIHADARAIFQQQVDRVTTPGMQTGHGRLLLVLGHAGSGKTHLMRAFRTQLHRNRQGYGGYLQMTSEVGDYARYVLVNLIDSLERPYFAPELEKSSLLYLSDAVAERPATLGPEELERLRTAELDPTALGSFVGGLVDRILRTDKLSGVDSDLVQALLLMQRRDPAIQRRVIKFLRCEPLTPHEQAVLGGLAPRVQPEDPARTIEQLARLMFDLEQSALVLLVDQVEDVVPGGGSPAIFQRTMDVLRRIADAVPSAVVVLSCLQDVYTEYRKSLTKSIVDRLERDPPPVRLVAQRTREQIEAMLVNRLHHLYDACEVAWREDDPIFPFRREELDQLTGQEARAVLAYFKKRHDACIAAGELVDAPTDTSAGPAAPPPPELDLVWNDLLASQRDVPEADDDEQLLQLVDRTIASCAAETFGMAEITSALEHGRLAVRIASGKSVPPRIVALCNARSQGGGLGNQLEALRAATPAGSVPVVLRTSDFSFGPKAKITRQLGELVKGGGLALTLEQNELRAMAAMRRMQEQHGKRDGFAEWRARRQPLLQLAVLRKLFDIEPVPVPVVDEKAKKMDAAPPQPAKPPKPAPPPAPQPPVDSAIRLGVTATMSKDPVTVTTDELVRHAVFLGSPGSGKTTLALLTCEQLLERGVSCLLVDRKGDLSRYASRVWWDEVPEDPAAAARKRALRERVKVSLFTPGDPNGRPLRLSVIPAGMAAMTSHERDAAARAAAAGLARMMQYGRGSAHRQCENILIKAIELHAEAGGSSLDDLRDTINQPDPRLLAEVGALTRYFGKLAEDLDGLAIQRGSFLRGEGETLDIPALLGSDRPNLVIVSTHALAEESTLEFWASRLLIDLARWIRSAPKPRLQAVAFFDEADLYIPATRTTATKEPMFDLLRRARAGGLGIFLASQNPADFDYRARDLINTWLVGKIAQDRAVEKMRALLGDYPNVAARLAAQTVGHFFLLNKPPARELRADRPLMTTAQLGEDEVTALARESRG